MTGVDAFPEVRFRVGDVRVALWPGADNPDDPEEIRITIDHRQDDRSYSEVLHAHDITAVILGLKKAAKYIQARKGQANQSDFIAADIKMEERIP